MKKLSVFVLLLSMAGLLAAEDKPAHQLITGDLTTGVYINQYAPGTGPLSQLLGTDMDFLDLLGSIRGGGDLAVRLNLTDLVSVGASGGVYAFSITDNLTGDSSVFADIPVRALVRLGTTGFNIEGHVGYLSYYAQTGTYVGTNFFNTLEYGAKATLAVFFLDYNIVGGAFPCNRIGVGLQLDKLFGF